MYIVININNILNITLYKVSVIFLLEYNVAFA